MVCLYVCVCVRVYVSVCIVICIAKKQGKFSLLHARTLEYTLHGCGL